LRSLVAPSINAMKRELAIQPPGFAPIPPSRTARSVTTRMRALRSTSVSRASAWARASWNAWRSTAATSLVHATSSRALAAALSHLPEPHVTTELLALAPTPALRAHAVGSKSPVVSLTSATRSGPAIQLLGLVPIPPSPTELNATTALPRPGQICASMASAAARL
jgi:hypothetical protein